MASRILQPLRLGRPLAGGPLCRMSAPGRPCPARPRLQGVGVRSLSLPAAAVVPAPAHVEGARAFSTAGPAYRAKIGAARELEVRRHTDKRKIVLSWLPPSRPVKLLFKEGMAAREAQEGYESRAVKVLGQPVAATKPRHGVKPFGWTVVLYGVPDAATQHDIVAGLATGSRPQDVAVGDKMAEADVDEMVGRLKEKVEAFGPILKWQYPIPSSRRAKAGALFEYPASAEEAVKALHKQHVEFRNGTRAQLAATMFTTIGLRMPVALYKATQAPIEEAMEPWKQKHLSVAMRTTTGDRYVVYKLSSDDINYQALVDAADAVEKILDGQVAVDDNGKPLWHPALHLNWPWYDMIKSLETKFPVYIVRSRSKAELRISGPWHECNLAMKKIAAIVAQAGSGDEPPSNNKVAPFL